jgi:hypothetical protein
LLEDALTRLALLPALQHVKLEYLATPGGLVTDDLLAAGTARAWGQLPQLRELRLRFKVSAAHTWQMEQVLEGLATATSLTMLHLQPFLKLADSCEAADRQRGLSAACDAALA